MKTENLSAEQKLTLAQWSLEYDHKMTKVGKLAPISTKEIDSIVSHLVYELEIFLAKKELEKRLNTIVNCADDIDDNYL